MAASNIEGFMTVPGSVTVCIGDLLQCDDQVIAHQCNCKTVGPVKGLAKHLFDKFRYANTYTENCQRAAGTIQVCTGLDGTRPVINLYAQVYPGVAREDRKNDTKAARLNHFASCLDLISQQKWITQIAFPYGIGCGLAGGEWLEYMANIVDWAAQHPHIRVRLYKRPETQ